MSAYLIGLDLGQQNDFTAISALKPIERPAGTRTITEHGESRRFDPFLGITRTVPAMIEREVELTETEYLIGHLEQVRGVSYTNIARRVKALTETPLFLDNCTVVVDATGVGRPVVDMLLSSGIRNLVPVTITGGDKVTQENGEYRVPKRDLAATVSVLLQTQRLHFAQGLTHAETAKQELQNFKVKISLQTGHDSYAGDWRDGDHDDLVLSIALAVWYGEYVPETWLGF